MIFYNKIGTDIIMFTSLNEQEFRPVKVINTAGNC